MLMPRPFKYCVLDTSRTPSFSNHSLCFPEYETSTLATNSNNAFCFDFIQLLGFWNLGVNYSLLKQNFKTAFTSCI